jgi:hypothetical protein
LDGFLELWVGTDVKSVTTVLTYLNIATDVVATAGVDFCTAGGAEVKNKIFYDSLLMGSQSCKASAASYLDGTLDLTDLTVMPIPDQSFVNSKLFTDFQGGTTSSANAKGGFDVRAACSLYKFEFGQAQVLPCVSEQVKEAFAQIVASGFAGPTLNEFFDTFGTHWRYRGVVGYSYLA